MKRQLDRDGRVLLERTPDERAPILRRLRLAEGQIRGLIEMVEADRYCGDELQQLAAVRAALREVSVVLATQHMEAAALHALESGEREPVLKDMMTVLRRALGQ
ncbi:DNA-binding FrmR family transcriptional regulator [Endobacter medicaginis]|uniref:DNA-binding FrmR family transcriptional regulator n=1 Tax=Endobacter medicaginis TaxID=1181271 RepID=A0A850NMU2_9PROT|nr:metal-sensitive transcriptional regulator [Endobacter medicaginis]MBB3175136.1 DNA-binding FrmR family transcriptional regulator [Endobacter medicaginis]MCX5476528.1 metal-sensitive transcriptional regulator [Endobacter medicaginis]NVN30893.1 metal-sensitive transcriptional regulator [Endobacter medicaginis]